VAGVLNNFLLARLPVEVPGRGSSSEEEDEDETSTGVESAISRTISVHHQQSSVIRRIFSAKTEVLFIFNGQQPIRSVDIRVCCDFADIQRWKKRGNTNIYEKRKKMLNKNLENTELNSY
jgi:hypothetical protein